MSEFYNNPGLKNLISSDGEFPNVDSLEVQDAVEVAENIDKRMLGCTLEVRGRKFILSSLEIYYGGVGDLAHDWLRSKFPEKVSHKKVSKANSELQIEEGLKIYLNMSGNSKFKRMDLVIGPKGIPITLLVRNALDVNLKLLGRKNGSPNIVLKEMGIEDSDHGKEVSDISDIKFFDTHINYVRDLNSQINLQKRVISGKAIGFDDNRFGHYLWNFTLKI